MNGTVKAATYFLTAPISRPAMRTFKRHQPQRIQYRWSTIWDTDIITEYSFTATASREILGIDAAACAGGVTASAKPANSGAVTGMVMATAETRARLRNCMITTAE